MATTSTDSRTEIETVEQLKSALIASGWDENIIQANMDVVEDAFRTSNLRDGLAMPIMTDKPSSLDNVRYDTPRPMQNVNTGSIYTRAEHDPIVIFQVLYDIKQRDLEQQKEAYEELVRQAAD